MRLSLHILREDLSDLGLVGRIRQGTYERTLLYPHLCEAWPSEPKAEVLYLVSAHDLPNVPPRYGRLSLICFGEPPDAWQRSTHSVVWTTEDKQPIDVLNDLTYLFWRYNHWESELRKIVEEGRPLEETAKVTQPLFNNPFAALSVSYRMLFSSFPDVREPSAEYLRYLESVSYDTPFMSDGDIVSIITADQFDEIRRSTEPVVFNTGGYDYPTLVYTIRVGEEACAYLCMDQTLSPITCRDRILWKHFGDFLGRALEKEDVYALTHPEVVREVLNGLLDHQLLPEGRIGQLLSHFSWDVNDTFVTMAVAIRETNNRAESLEALALSLARATANDCYIIRGDVICQVFDLTKMGLSRNRLIERVEPLLSPLWLDASASSCFDDFKNLYYYFEQAKIAGWIGWHEDPSKIVYRFEDESIGYMMHRLSEKCGPSIAEVLIPDELKLLVEHDHLKGTEYAHLLDVYLRNERNIAKTIRQEYIHRNTFNYRLRRIEEISGIDLDDEDMRLRLLVAFRLLEREGAK